MFKTVSPLGWDFERPTILPIKYGSRGLIGEDRREFLKTAAAEFGPQLSSLKIAEDEVPIHLLALGASEFWGANRNGDGFKSAVCRRRHNTFVKHAKWYRNHRNKKDQGDPYFGTIKASAYNDDMHRVELIVALNAKEAAARRNGGFVADAELQKIARHEDIAVSMAAYVPYDVCSFCNNKAKNRAEYCTREKCAAGGCRDNLAKIVKVGNDVHHLHVDNPDDGRFVWFDISNVTGPADRTAYGAIADYLVKAASNSSIRFDTAAYMKFAEDQTIPNELFLARDGFTMELAPEKFGQIKLAEGLALLEKNPALFEAETWRAVTTPSFPVEKFASFGSARCDAQLAALADRNVLLKLSDYARLTSREHLVKTAEPMLPMAYTVLTADDTLAMALGRSTALQPRALPATLQAFAADHHAVHSFRKDAVDQRILRSCIYDHNTPGSLVYSRVADSDSFELVRDYSLYKLAAMWRAIAQGYDPAEVARFGLAQNRIPHAGAGSDL